MRPTRSLRATAWHAQRSPRAQAANQLSLECSTTLNVKGLIDGLVRDSHGLVLGEVDLETARNLLGAPSLKPLAILLLAALVATIPGSFRRSRMDGAVGVANLSGEPLLNVVLESFIGHHLGDFWTLGEELGFPLGHRRSVVNSTTSSGGVAPQLARDGRRTAIQVTSDIAHALALNSQEGYLLSFMEGEVATRDRRQVNCWHSTTLSEPS